MNIAVDVLINVFSKPYQTALALLSLLRHSGRHVDRIYFHEERAGSSFERHGHAALLRLLGDRVTYFKPALWLDNIGITADRCRDQDYRHAIRYQYGFEKSDKKYVVVMHNDIVVHADVVGFFLERIAGHSGVGEIGQCWWCPAGQNGLCSSERYREVRLGHAEVLALYARDFDPTKRRAYHYGLGEAFVARPWPLPECRLNEWCALIDLEKTRPDTLPLGPAMPLGAQVASGAAIGQGFDEPVNLDTGVQWFRTLNHLGHTFGHVDIYGHIEHERRGRGALMDPERYVQAEMRAKARLKKDYPEFVGP